MSRRTGEAAGDAKGMSKKHVQGSPSNWMGHWMRTSHSTSAETCIYGSSGNQELSRGDNLTSGLCISNSVKALGVIETKTFEIVNEGLTISSKDLGNEPKPSSFFKFGQDTNDVQAVRHVFGHHSDRGKAVDYRNVDQFPAMFTGVPVGAETSSKSGHSMGEGTSKYPIAWMRTQSSTKDSCSLVLKPLQERFVESSPQVLPYRFHIKQFGIDKRKGIISKSSPFSNNKLPSTELRMLENEHYHGHGPLADLGHENMKEAHVDTDYSLNPCFKESNTSFLFDAPSKNDHHLPIYSPGWFQKMQHVRPLQSQFVALGEPKSKTSHYDPYSLKKFTNCDHDMEAVRMCTTVDSVERLHCPRISQKTHSFVITKKTDVHLSDDNDVFGSTSVIAKINGSTSSDLYNLPPVFCQGNRGVKLQPLSSSSGGEEKGNVGVVKASKVTIRNESSADTDTMDMDNLTENLHSGANSTPSKKIDVGSSSKVGRGWPNNRLPDINLELPAFPAAASVSENACPSSSRTQSLEMDLLLGHAERPKSKSSLSLGDGHGADPSSRWVKRLKLSSPASSAKGTKSSVLVENSSHEKISTSFSRILKNTISSLDPATMRPHCKESNPSEKSADTLHEDENFLLHQFKKSKQLLMPHAWIQRWLSNESRTFPKKPGAVVVCEPGSSKLVLEDLEKKQFPSIAAMALMGKAMSGFQQCELQKRGSFTVWNTKAF